MAGVAGKLREASLVYVLVTSDAAAVWLFRLAVYRVAILTLVAGVFTAQRKPCHLPVIELGLGEFDLGIVAIVTFSRR